MDIIITDVSTHFCSQLYYISIQLLSYTIICKQLYTCKLEIHIAPYSYVYISIPLCGYIKDFDRRLYQLSTLWSRITTYSYSYSYINPPCSQPFKCTALQISYPLFLQLKCAFLTHYGYCRQLYGINMYSSYVYMPFVKHQWCSYVVS